MLVVVFSARFVRFASCCVLGLYLGGADWQCPRPLTTYTRLHGSRAACEPAQCAEGGVLLVANSTPGPACPWSWRARAAKGEAEDRPQNICIRHSSGPRRKREGAGVLCVAELLGRASSSLTDVGLPASMYSPTCSCSVLSIGFDSSLLDAVQFYRAPVDSWWTPRPTLLLCVASDAFEPQPGRRRAVQSVNGEWKAEQYTSV